MKKNESGMVVVETVISFTTFIMVCLGIVFLINVFVLHNKVQYAINQAAHEIASYSYLYDALGARQAEIGIRADGAAYTGQIDETTDQFADTYTQIGTLWAEIGETGEVLTDFNSYLDPSILSGQLDSLLNSGQSALDSGKASVESLKTALKDPKGLLVGFLYIGAEGLSHAAKGLLASVMADALTEKYLAAGGTDVDRYLENFGIEGGYDGLDFSGSTIFCDDDLRMIDLVCEYDIDLGFITFVLPNTTYHVTQRVSVGAWAGGDGQVVTVGKSK